MTARRIIVALLLIVTAAWAALLAYAAWWALHQEASWWLLAVAGVLITCGSLSVAVHLGRENVDLRAEVADLEDDVADLSAALAEATATLADARVVIPLRPVPIERPDLRVIPPQRSDSWLEQVMDEQARLGEDGAS